MNITDLKVCLYGSVSRNRSSDLLDSNITDLKVCFYGFLSSNRSSDLLRRVTFQRGEMKKKSSPRLKAFDYQGAYAYFITIGTHQKQRYFENPGVVEFALKHLAEEAQRHSCEIYVYCFMPDHLHLLVRGEDDTRLGGFVKAFKQMTGFYFKKKYTDKLWHLSYYDHVLRSEESLLDVASYILNNPVRAGMVESFKHYPYLGSLVFDIDEMH